MALNLNGCKKKLKEFRKVYGTSLGINRIGIFGSVARGENTDDSDIDIVVDVTNRSFSSKMLTWFVIANHCVPC